MRIDDLNRTASTQSTEKAGPTATARTSEKESSVGSDQAEVSQTAQSLAAPDPGRIEQLRLQVQSGNYDVPAQTVANALIDSHIKETLA
jgi:anti-sigma28 factor (negative regulator of flagellin synthesis)